MVTSGPSSATQQPVPVWVAGSGQQRDPSSQHCNTVQCNWCRRTVLRYSRCRRQDRRCGWSRSPDSLQRCTALRQLLGLTSAGEEVDWAGRGEEREQPHHQPHRHPHPRTGPHLHNASHNHCHCNPICVHLSHSIVDLLCLVTGGDWGDRGEQGVVCTVGSCGFSLADPYSAHTNSGDRALERDWNASQFSISVLSPLRLSLEPGEESVGLQPR